MAGLAVPNQIALDSVRLRHKEETDKVYLGEDDVGGGCGVVGMLSNEELDILES